MLVYCVSGLGFQVLGLGLQLGDFVLMFLVFKVVLGFGLEHETFSINCADLLVFFETVHLK